MSVHFQTKLMADIQLNFESRDIRVIIAYCLKRKLIAKEAENEIISVLGPNTVSYATVTKWYRNFKFGVKSFDDAERVGAPVTVTTEENVIAIKELLKEDPRITLRQISEILRISTESSRHILRDILKARYVCIQWVPHLLTDSQMMSRLKICKENLKWFRSEGKNLINRLVSGDETWGYYYDNLSSKEAKIWVLEDEEILKMPRREVNVKKVMYAVFFRSTGIVKVVKLGKGEKITSDWYINKCLSQVFAAINEKRKKSGLKRIVLHHDNARPHKAWITAEYLNDLGIILMPHPAYSPDLAPCDFWLFKNLKNS